VIYTGRRLVVMRHAKAEPFAPDDHGRVLTGRGRRDAVEAGLWLSAHGIAPDHVFVSSALRTVGTWEALSHGLRSVAEVAIDDSLYSAEPETVLEVLRTSPIDAAVVALVGHNPAVAYLAHALDGGEPDPVAFREMSEGYPTAALAVLEVDVPWADLDLGTARITHFHVGHGAAHTNS
jgi:phosphohistidine phosphatase